MSRTRHAGRRRAALVVGAAAATAGGVVALARRRGWNTVAQLRERAAAAAGGRAAPAGAEQWTCACGTRFRMTGAGRHQVFWLADAPEDQPVLDDRCPSCDRPLPGSGGSDTAPEGVAPAESAPGG